MTFICCFQLAHKVRLGFAQCLFIRITGHSWYSATRVPHHDEVFCTIMTIVAAFCEQRILLYIGRITERSLVCHSSTSCEASMKRKLEEGDRMCERVLTNGGILWTIPRQRNVALVLWSHRHCCCLYWCEVLECFQIGLGENQVLPGGRVSACMTS